MLFLNFYEKKKKLACFKRLMRKCAEENRYQLGELKIRLKTQYDTIILTARQPFFIIYNFITLEKWKCSESFSRVLSERNYYRLKKNRIEFNSTIKT